MAAKGHTRTRVEHAELLLEIGTEELPSQFVAPALQALEASAVRLLKEFRLEYGACRTLGTPRRLTLVVERLRDRQAAVLKEAMGPSKTVAFDAAGAPTKAALGFAAAHELAVEHLEIRSTPKGDYLFAVKKEHGKATHAVLPEVLRQIVEGLSFPKSMRWNQSGLRFGRPIRWLTAVYGGKPVLVSVGGVTAGDATVGHRVIGSTRSSKKQRLRVENFESYESVLRRHGVVPDPTERRKLIAAQVETLARKAGGIVHRDDALLEQAVYSTEWPNALLGAFNPHYLALPQDVLMTSMKEHQGFFSLLRKNGTLLPAFVAVTNTKASNMAVIRRGNERVLAARLADAKFFFDEDRKKRLEERAVKLGQVVFHQKLGTLAQKRDRMGQLVVRLLELVGPEQMRSLGVSPDKCKRAAELAKADLLTGMVGEFPTLQGIMGGEYAKHDGEPEEVCQAIAEQYRPQSMEDQLPATAAGCLVSLADRLDTVAAFFSVGIVPTGSEDPLALRRHATAIVRLLVETKLAPIRLDLALAEAKTLVQGDGFTAPQGQQKAADPLPFILERLRYYAKTLHGLRDDVIQAVLATVHAAGAGPCEVRDCLNRMKAIQAIASQPAFDPLIVGFKRAHRIVDKEQWAGESVDPTLFLHPCEQELHRALVRAQETMPDLLARRDYGTLLEALIALKPAIDGFFEGVMVNAEDPQLRGNRLSLLRAVDRLFLSFADFSQILVPGA